MRTPDTALYLFSNDLRLDDNPALAAAAKSERLICVYCIDPNWFRPGRYQLASMGPHRWRFRWQALLELKQALAALGQPLQILYGNPVTEVVRMAKLYSVNRLISARPFGIHEQQQLDAITRQCPLTLEFVDNYTLFSPEQLSFSLAELPANYSGFRREVEQLPLSAPIERIDSLPVPPPLITPPELPPKLTATGSGLVKGGENAAHQHLQRYLSGDLPRHYKEVRNTLDGWENSSKLSFWLNSGTLSTRRVMAALREYESRRGANESTHWLFVELLWREYFQWLALKQGVSLFSFRGLASSPPLTSFYPERFSAWCQGRTPWPLVNACMEELKQTGYLSNRGRQIAASALVNELSVDWRYGAAWFEQQLIDYDVAVNWGNWQYIAGVGVDPRGGRHFNLEKQASQFDPQGRYQRRWTSTSACQPLDFRDASDWPIMPEPR